MDYPLTYIYVTKSKMLKNETCYDTIVEKFMYVDHLSLRSLFIY